MRKLFGLILVNLSRFSTMNIRNPPISAIAFRSPPSTAVFISEISIVLQNNLQSTASSIIKQDSVIGETSKLLSETVCKISENPDVHTNDEVNLQNILQGKEANTPLVESEPFVEFQSILQKSNKYDSCTNEQNSPSKLVLNDSLTEDLLYEETKSHIVIKEAETIVSNLQINKQNSLLSKWKPVSKKKEVLPGYMLEKVTNIIQLVYKNNEILTINQAICPFGNMHCQESGIDVNIGHKCSIQIPLLKSRHSKAPYTYKQQFKSENKSKVKTLVKNNDKRGVKTKEPHRKNNNNKPSEQKISVDKESVDNVRCDLLPERKSTVNSLLDKIDTRTSSKKNMLSKNSRNKTKLNRQNYQKQPDKTQTTVSSETQINLKKVSNKASKKVGTEQSSENNLAGPKTESWYSSDVKRRFKVAKQKPKANLNSQCSNRMQEKLIRTKKGSTKFNKRAESRSSIPTCSVLSTPEDGRPDPDGQSMDNFISKLSLDVLMEPPSAEEFGLYDLTDLFSVLPALILSYCICNLI